ncbi:MAG: HupE/UreJ family protein [Akkermansiaceae bacterium]|nr:HupE/UreJ family protein [Akkermansiaceae bacterium]
MKTLRFLLTWIALITSAQAHVVSQIAGELKKSETWEIEVLLDVGLAIPETRDNPTAPAPQRKWLVNLGENSWAPLRKEAELYLRENLHVKSAGESASWKAEFIDFAKSPPDFPELLTDGAYFRIKLKGEKSLGTGAQIFWNQQALPSFVLVLPGKATEYLVITPGESKPLPTKNQPFIANGRPSWIEALKQGFLHVLPKGLDHILFIMGLFFYQRSWRSLLSQSLTFTFAHTVTLGLAAGGIIKISGNWIEPFIALSLIVVALENLRAVKKPHQPVRLLIVFGFGLLHGLGFAGALSVWLQPGAGLLTSLLSANIGVEIGQAAILIMAWILTIGWNETMYYRKFRAFGCITIAIIGGFLCSSALVDKIIPTLFFPKSKFNAFATPRFRKIFLKFFKCPPI